MPSFSRNEGIVVLAWGEKPMVRCIGFWYYQKNNSSPRLEAPTFGTKGRLGGVVLKDYSMGTIAMI
jgi:hypothetical protein